MVKTARWFTLFILKRNVSLQQVCIINNKKITGDMYESKRRIEKKEKNSNRNLNHIGTEQMRKQKMLLPEKCDFMDDNKVRSFFIFSKR